MGTRKSEKIKIYVVVGLTMVMIVLGYFRFIHGSQRDASDPSSSAKPSVKATIPPLEVKPLKKAGWAKLSPPELPRSLPRDIFEAPAAYARTETPLKAQRQEKKPPSFKLAGVIVGGLNPIAIVNNQFVRTGDWVDGYQVVRIEKTGVLLDSGKRKIDLEMLGK